MRNKYYLYNLCSICMTNELMCLKAGEVNLHTFPTLEDKFSAVNFTILPGLWSVAGDGES